MTDVGLERKDLPEAFRALDLLEDPWELPDFAVSARLFLTYCMVDENDSFSTYVCPQVGKTRALRVRVCQVWSE